MVQSYKLAQWKNKTVTCTEMKIVGARDTNIKLLWPQNVNSRVETSDVKSKMVRLRNIHSLFEQTFDVMSI